MPLQSSNVQSLVRVFQQAFVVHDIAQPLVSFDDTTSANYVREFMDSRRFEIVGIRQQGLMRGYVERTDLGEGICADYLQPIQESHIVLDSASLAELVLRLNEHRRLFVSTLGQVGGIVSRTDLNRPPVRMWLFGMVTLIEMRFARLIERACPDDSWQQFLSDGRVQKATALLEERMRRNQDLALLDCLQFSDKAQIVARNQPLRELTNFQSRRKLEEAAKMIEQLRNNLAHAQDIVTSDWKAIVALAENMDSILSGPPGLREES